VSNEDALVPTVQQRGEAYDLFLNGGCTPTQIAIAVGAHVDDIRRWIKAGGWVARRDLIEKEVFAVHEAEYRKLLIEHKLPTLRKQLEQAKMIGEKLDEFALSRDGSTMKAGEIKALAEALASYAAVQAKVVGLPDYVVQPSGGGAERTKQPLVMIGLQVTAAPKDDGSLPAINVTQCTSENVSP
jgi:hypothetical protein